jgi:O-antigen/teichoic acid export membrane protein
MCCVVKKIFLSFYKKKSHSSNNTDGAILTSKTVASQLVSTDVDPQRACVVDEENALTWVNDDKQKREVSLHVGETKLPSSCDDYEGEFLAFGAITIKTPIFVTHLPELGDNETVNQASSNLHAADYDTIPMMVLKDLTSRQGDEVPVMQTEISGAAGGAAIVGIGNIVGSVLKFGSNYLLQVGFGAALYGLYSIALALIQLIASLCNLGLGDTTIRYTAIYQTRQQMRPLYGLIIFCSGLAGVMGIMGAVGLIVFAPTLAATKNEPRLVPLLGLMAPLIPLMSLQVVWFGSLQGLKLFKWRIISERIIIPVVLLVVIIVFFVFTPSLFIIASATIISVGLGTFAGSYWLYRSASLLVKGRRPRFEIREWIVFSLFNFLTSITEVVLESVDTLLLVVYAVDNSQVGQYNAAIKISDFIAMPLFSLTTMFAPTIAELHSKSEHVKLGIMYKVVNKWTITLSLPIFLVATLFSRTLLQLSGRSFVDAWPLLVVSAIGSLVNAATGSVGYILLMTGHQKWSFVNSVTSVALNVIFGAVLIPRYGAMGAALGTMSALILLNIIRYIQVRFILKMNPYAWDVFKPFGAGILAGAITGCLLLLLAKMSVFVHLLLIPVCLVCYFGFLMLFKVGPEDKVVIDALRQKILRTKKG